MALRRNQLSCVPPPISQRRALNEIGNIVRQQNVYASICVEISKENPRTTSKLRRSTRLSVAHADSKLPKMATRITANPKESLTVNGKSAQPQPKVKVMGPPVKAPNIQDRSRTRVPRLTMKPPAVETPLAERLACQKLIQQSLAEEKNRRFTMAITTEIQSSQSRQDVEKVSKAKKQTVSSISIVDDIDEAHSKCFWMMTTYSKQVYAYLQRLDRRMASKMATHQLTLVRETSRTKLVEWMASVYLKLNLLQETFQMSVSILDRYLLRVKDLKDTKCELVAVTCLSLGIKYEELLTTLVKELLSLSSRPYTLKEFIEMEADVIKELGYQVARPVPLVFLRRYNTAAKCGRTQHSFGKYFIDLAQYDTSLAYLPCSSLAAASTFIGITLKAHKLDVEAWNQVMVHYTTLSFDDIVPIVSRMAMLVLPGGPQCRYLKQKYAAEASYLSTDTARHLMLALHDLSFPRTANS